jgi:predicted MFS family arabinose efflux permease
MVFPMASALIGHHIPIERRTNAISYLMAGTALLYLIGMPLINYLDDWRHSFLIVSTSLLILSLVLTIVYIPSEETVQRSSDVLAGYKGVFSSRSAVACLFGHVFGNGAWMISANLAFSFFRDVFLMSRSNVVYLTFDTSFGYLLGALSSRRVIPWLGRRKSTIVSLVSIGLFSWVYLAGVNHLVSLLFVLLFSILGGLYHSSSQGLNLEQLPLLRGSMMSMFNAFGNVGSVIGFGLGGLVLVWYGWRGLGVFACIFSLIGSIILNLYALEPEIQ